MGLEPTTLYTPDMYMYMYTGLTIQVDNEEGPVVAAGCYGVYNSTWKPLHGSAEEGGGGGEGREGGPGKEGGKGREGEGEREWVHVLQVDHYSKQ